MCSKQKEELLVAQDYTHVIGIDEAGAGCLAGPVTVCSCYIPLHVEIKGINDSKKISENKRNKIYKQLIEHPDVKYVVVHIDHDKVDEINILQARFLGMKQSYDQLIQNLKLSQESKHAVLIDGNQIPPAMKSNLDTNTNTSTSTSITNTNSTAPYIESIVKGDGKCYCIAAASIIAKVTRDQLMINMDQSYPGYSFTEHKGYGTKKHYEALNKLGPSIIHRRTFKGVVCDNTILTA